MARRKGSCGGTRRNVGSLNLNHPEWIITSVELKSAIGKVTLLDVREPEEFAESRIEGCKLIPLGEVQTRAENELNKSDDIVIYCAHGVRSLHALRAMAMMGFKKLRSLDGGICAWEEYLQSRS
jgi:rhodanese-related sulfurtransferase